MVAHRKHMIVRMQYLQRSQLSEEAVRISRDSPLFRLQREISGVLYLQRIAVISMRSSYAGSSFIRNLQYQKSNSMRANIRKPKQHLRDK